MSERVIVAMSGGVDSSVAAARLLAAGHDVVGVTLHLWDYPDDGSVKSRCCAPEDIHDARRVADHLGFPHYAFDRRELFQSEVVAPFVDSYLSGETPSPCVRCNRGVKSRELFTLRARLGAAKVATGHYARITRQGERCELRRGRVVRSNGQIRVDVAAPVSAVVKGQYAVFYEGDRVLGGGVIESNVTAPATEELRP